MPFQNIRVNIIHAMTLNFFTRNRGVGFTDSGIQQFDIIVKFRGRPHG